MLHQRYLPTSKRLLCHSLFSLVDADIDVLSKCTVLAASLAHHLTRTHLPVPADLRAAGHARLQLASIGVDVTPAAVKLLVRALVHIKSYSGEVWTMASGIVRSTFGTQRAEPTQRSQASAVLQVLHRFPLDVHVKLATLCLATTSSKQNKSAGGDTVADAVAGAAANVPEPACCFVVSSRSSDSMQPAGTAAWPRTTVARVVMSDFKVGSNQGDASATAYSLDCSLGNLRLACPDGAGRGGEVDVASAIATSDQPLIDVRGATVAYDGASRRVSVDLMAHVTGFKYVWESEFKHGVIEYLCQTIEVAEGWRLLAPVTPSDAPRRPRAGSAGQQRSVNPTRMLVAGITDPDGFVCAECGEAQFGSLIAVLHHIEDHAASSDPVATGGDQAEATAASLFPATVALHKVTMGVHCSGAIATVIPYSANPSTDACVVRIDGLQVNVASTVSLPLLCVRLFVLSMSQLISITLVHSSTTCMRRSSLPMPVPTTSACLHMEFLSMVMMLMMMWLPFVVCEWLAFRELKSPWTVRCPRRVIGFGVCCT